MSPLGRDHRDDGCGPPAAALAVAVLAPFVVLRRSPGPRAASRSAGLLAAAVVAALGWALGWTAVRDAGRRDIEHHPERYGA